MLRKEGTGYVFNAFLAPDAIRFPDPQGLCGALCKKVEVSFIKAEQFQKFKKIPTIKKQNQEKVDDGVRVTLAKTKTVLVKPNQELLNIDGGATLSPLGFIDDLPLLSWSGHMGDGFVVLDKNSGKIQSVHEGFAPQWSFSQTSLAYLYSNGESDQSWLTIHFANDPPLRFSHKSAWCIAGKFVFEDDQTLLAEVMRQGDCGNPEYDSLRTQMKVYVRISRRR